MFSNIYSYFQSDLKNPLFKPSKKLFPHIFWALFSTLLAQSLLWCSLWLKNYAGGIHRYIDNSAPLQTSADGYFYLALADGKSNIALETLGLSDVLYWLDFLLPIPELWLCYLIPTFLMVISGLIFGFWGKLLAWSPFSTGLAALIASALPPVIYRTHPGWFDNDPLNLIFWYLGMLAIACLLNKKEFLGFCLLVFAELGMLWTWNPGLILLPLGLAVYAFCFFLENNRKIRIFRFTLLISGLACFFFFIFVPALIPDILLPYHRLFWEVIDLVSMPFGAGVGGTIQELMPMTFEKLVSKLAYTWQGLLVLFIGLGFFIFRFPFIVLPCLPAFLMFALSFTAQRFLFLSILPFALGVGALVLTKNRLVFLLSACIPLAFSVFLLIKLHTFHPGFIFDTPDDGGARAIATEVEKSDTLVGVWNWWDDGYFLLARANVLSLFNGGNQDDTRQFVSARPLVHWNPRVSSSWMRFFALRGIENIKDFPEFKESGSGEHLWELLAESWGENWPTMLESIFAANNPAEILDSYPPLPVENPLQWLYPEGRVFLYLPQRFLSYANVWIGFGRTYPLESLKQQYIAPYYKPNIPDYTFGTIPKILQDQGYNNLTMINITLNPLSQETIEQIPQAVYLIDSNYSPYFYITDTLGLRSVALRLMAPSGFQLPRFKPLHVQYGTSMVWEVLPE